MLLGDDEGPCYTQYNAVDSFYSISIPASIGRRGVDVDHSGCEPHRDVCFPERGRPLEALASQHSMMRTGQDDLGQINHDPYPMQVFALPPPSPHPDDVPACRWPRKMRHGQCEMCKLLARVPYPVCGFCKKRDVYHHGRCCPSNPLRAVEQPLCEICGIPASLPYASCHFCGGKQVLHHGRCCLERNGQSRERG